MIKIFNTLSGKKEPLPKKRPLRLFVCGPTVYDYPHIGNARTFMAFDIIARYLRSQKIKVSYLQNITDIDDKIIARAAEEKTSWKETAKKYEKIFYQNLKDLNINSVDKFARATDYIPEILKQVKTLIKKGNAYKIPGDGWYFDLKTFSDYGKLARRTIAQAEDGVSRIDASSQKRNAGDFCLWKFSKTGEPSWKTDLGAGRPGWHIEDTAISEKFFGPQYDLHGGALDLKFPHHEAEIAQQESASGKKPFVKIWMHAGFLYVNGQKMSKSLGNFLTVNDFLKNQRPEIFRMMALSHHYRAPMDYTENLAKTARKNLYEIKVFLAKLKLISKSRPEAKLNLSHFKKQFQSAMKDDFNTPKALGAIFELINDANKNIWKLNKAQSKAIRNFIEIAFSAFGIGGLTMQIPSKIAKLAEKRELCRAHKQFTQSDSLRKEIEALGFIIEDTQLGPLVLKNN